MAVVPKNQLPPTINRANQFGSFARDPNHQYITEPNYPYFQDATASPQKSPVAIASNAVVTIDIPASAIRINFCSTVQFRVSDLNTVDSAAPYASLPPNQVIPFPCVTPSSDPNDTTGQIFVCADSTSGNLSFWFDCV